MKRIDLVNPWQRREAARLIRLARTYAPTNFRALNAAAASAYAMSRVPYADEVERCNRTACRFIADRIQDALIPALRA